MDINPSHSLISDHEIANHLSMSKSWVRQQRWLRRHDKPHFLDIDPIMIGTSPRYKAADVDAFIGNLVEVTENGFDADVGEGDK